MADNNINQDPNQDPFAHPIRRNNWWLYIFGGLVLAGIIAWFFIDWSYKNRHGEEKIIDQTEQVQQLPTQTQTQQETLPTVTVEGEAGQ